MTHPNPEPPIPEQATARLWRVLEKDYDMEGDPSSPLQDLLTDVLHMLDHYEKELPDRDDLDLYDLLDRARHMRDVEKETP